MKPKPIKLTLGEIFSTFGNTVPWELLLFLYETLLGFEPDQDWFWSKWTESSLEITITDCYLFCFISNKLESTTPYLKTWFISDIILEIFVLIKSNVYV